MMAESLHSRAWRLLANCAPAYWATGARVVYIARDFREVHIRLPLTWRTRNHLNMIWGGSLYGALDPVYGVMLHKLLGPDFLVVDKAATIAFKRPGRTCLYARFVLDAQEIEAIHDALRTHHTTDRHYRVELCDREGVVHVICHKTVHVRKLASERTAHTHTHRSRVG